MTNLTAIPAAVLVSILSLGVDSGVPFCGAFVKPSSTAFSSETSSGLKSTSLSLLCLARFSTSGLASSTASLSSSGVNLGLVGLLFEVYLIQGFS